MSSSLLEKSISFAIDTSQAVVSYVARASHLTAGAGPGPGLASADSASVTEDSTPYMCICQTVKTPPSFEDVPVPKSDRTRRRYVPPFDTVEVQIGRADGGDGSKSAGFWRGSINYEEHNVTRKKAGGRDDTWAVDLFIYKVADALQHIADRPNISVKIKQSEDGDSIGLEIKENVNGVIWSFLKNVTLVAEDSMQLNEFVPLFKEMHLSSLVDICRVGDVERARRRCLNGININSTDTNGWTLLQYACHCGHLEIVEWLADDAGVDLNLSEDPADLPILCAARNDQIEIVEFLISRGVLVSNGSTSNDTVVSVLLDHKYKYSIETICGDEGPVAAETLTVSGVRDTTPVVGFFQLP
jgi:hypothetical protein